MNKKTWQMCLNEYFTQRWGWSGALNQSDVLSCAVAKHEEKDAWREWMGDVDDDMLM